MQYIMIGLYRWSVKCIFQFWKLAFLSVLPNDVPCVHPSTYSSEQKFYPCINPIHWALLIISFDEKTSPLLLPNSLWICLILWYPANVSRWEKERENSSEHDIGLGRSRALFMGNFTAHVTHFTFIIPGPYILKCIIFYSKHTKLWETWGYCEHIMARGGWSWDDF